MDDLEGGSLYNKIIRNNQLSEENAATITAFLVSIVKYMHNNDIVLRNLRPETIYFEEAGDSLNIKLVDLSLAIQLRDIEANCDDYAYEEY